MAAKDEILLILEQHRGNNISGQFMADQLSVSRNAVWKAIDRLKKEGYQIESAAEGYRLVYESDRLIGKKIRKLLSDPEFDLVLLDRVDSTNNECKRRISAGEANFAVLSEEQTEGRGRGGKSFYSPEEKGLYMSLALRHSLPIDRAVRITTYTAVCLVEEIKRLTGASCQIKWVNDIFLDGKKVAGILTEAVTDMESGMVTDVIIGIGINLHPGDLPDDLKMIAGFLSCGPVKNELAAALINRLSAYKADDLSHMERYRTYSMVIGKPVSFTVNGQTFAGTAIRIDDSGALHVDTPEGKKTLRSGGISLL